MGRKLTSLSDFQETPIDDAPPEPVLIPEAAPAMSAPAPAPLLRREAVPVARPAPLRRAHEPVAALGDASGVVCVARQRRGVRPK
jgi:hypothetical protein